MILTKEVTIKWNASNKKRYEDTGYLYTKLHDDVVVRVEDLAPYSLAEINAECDYCNENYKTTWSNYLNSIKTINKCCCSDTECMSKKRTDILQFRYGVSHNTELQSTIEKQKETNLKRYGVEWGLQSETIREKTKETMLERYGEDNYAKTAEYAEKVIKTSLKKYGVDNPNKSSIVQLKKNKTMLENGSTRTSKQQIYLHKLYGGELNHMIKASIVDIAFPSNKIYIEYDGSGHDLSVKCNQMTQQAFDNKEMRRYYALRYEGWNCIRIKSDYDKLPTDEILSVILNYAYDWIESGHSWIHFNIDHNQIETSDGLSHFEFGEIKKIS